MTTKRDLAVAALTGVAAVAITTALATYEVKPDEGYLPEPNAIGSPITATIIHIVHVEPNAIKTRCVSITVEDKTKTKCVKLRGSEVKALQSAAIVTKDCGTIKERGVKCPKLFPKEKRCAVCPDGLCRYGMRGEKACDPDAKDCVPHPCEIMYGDDPDIIAAESSNDDVKPIEPVDPIGDIDVKR